MLATTYIREHAVTEQWPVRKEGKRDLKLVNYVNLKDSEWIEMFPFRDRADKPLRRARLGDVVRMQCDRVVMVELFNASAMDYITTMNLGVAATVYEDEMKVLLNYDIFDEPLEFRKFISGLANRAKREEIPMQVRLPLAEMTCLLGYYNGHQEWI